MNETEEAAYLKLLEDELRYRQENHLLTLYPDTGPLRRELYPKHLAHFAAGAMRDENGDLYNERAIMGGNRSGKTLCCCYEHTCHLLGWYPPWWVGFRFDRAISSWAAGEDSKSVRESLQHTFLGSTGAYGTGLIPKSAIVGVTPRPGVPEAADAITVKSRFGGTSRVLLKAYDQGRESFQAAKIDVMQFDEEPPVDIYSEALVRTMSTTPGEPNGLVMCGFTPLKGLSAVVLSYMPGGRPTEGAVRRDPAKTASRFSG